MTKSGGSKILMKASGSEGWMTDDKYGNTITNTTTTTTTTPHRPLAIRIMSGMRMGLPILALVLIIAYSAYLFSVVQWLTWQLAVRLFLDLPTVPYTHIYIQRSECIHSSILYLTQACSTWEIWYAVPLTTLLWLTYLIWPSTQSRSIRPVVGGARYLPQQTQWLVLSHSCSIVSRQRCQSEWFTYRGAPQLFDRASTFHYLFTNHITDV